MKKVFYMLFLLAGIACSNDDPAESSNSGNIALKTTIADDSEAANMANPYDDRGKAYLQLLDSYKALQTLPTGDTEIIASIEAIAASLGIADSSYDPTISQNIRHVKQLSISNLDSAIAGLNITTSAQAQLYMLLNELTGLKQQDASYDTVYAVLINREQAILQSGLPSHDTAVLLSTLSIVRHSVYSKSRRKRRDRDWELSVGNVMAAAYGAKTSRPNAIISGGASEFIN